MAKGGRRYPLLVYRELVNRWWPEIFWMGVGLLGLAWLVHFNEPSAGQAWLWKSVAALAGATFAVSLLLYLMRGVAYVQPFPTHLRLVTPILRINISYKRLLRYTTSEMRGIFPPSKRMSGWKREVLSKLGGKTAVVLELNGWPADPKMMRLFLSPLFFRDRTPNFVLLVEDWMRLSLEIDSMRTGGGTQQPSRLQNQSILGRLPRKDQ
jgi:hypothetical protein